MKERESTRQAESSTREPLSDRELAGFLCSSNNEAKSLLIASMMPHQIYSRVQLQDLMNAPQLKPGGSDVWNIDSGKLRDWCSASFLPGGLLVREKDGYSLKAEKADLSVAFNGHVLAFSEEHPQLALMPFLGRSSVNAMALDADIDGQLKEAPPSPLTRYRIFKQLLRMSVPSFKADVEDALLAEYPYQYRKGFLKTPIVALSNLGIVDSIVGDGAATFTYQSAPRETQTIFRSPAALSMIELLRSEPDKHWTMSILHEVLRERGVVHQQDKAGLRQTLHTANNLAREGYALKDVRQSEIIVTGEQRKVLSSFVTIVDRFVSRDSTFIAEGKAKAAAIVSSPERFCRLLEKSEKRIVDKKSTAPELTKERVVAFLAANPDSTVVDIQEHIRNVHGQDLTGNRIWMIATELCKEKAIVLTEKGRVYRYSAPES